MPRKLIILPCTLAALAAAAYTPACADGRPREPTGEILRIPGFPPVQLPPGTHVFGPGQSGAGNADADGDTDPLPDRNFARPPRNRPRQGEVPNNYGTVIGPGGVVKPMPPLTRPAEPLKKKELTPEEKAAEIRKALAPKPPLSFARRHTLDDLYGKLANASDADEAKGLAQLIGSIWMRSGSDTADLLMRRAMQAVDKANYPLALTLLDRIVALDPGWAEGWNKRASVRFYKGDLDGSMADVEHVLKLEPNHFGALVGMATIMEKTGLEKRALQVYRRALAIYPHQPDVEKIVEKLTLDVEGQGI